MGEAGKVTEVLVPMHPPVPHAASLTDADFGAAASGVVLQGLVTSIRTGSRGE